MSGLDDDSYRELLRRAIVGGHDPENVILMEIHPQEQKTLPDFLLTEKMLGMRTVDIVDHQESKGRSFITSATEGGCRSGGFITGRLWTNCSASK